MPLKGRASRQRRRTTSTTKGGGSVSRQEMRHVANAPGAPPGVLVPQQVTVTETTPSSTTTEEQQSSGSGQVSIGGASAHGGVLFMELLLLFVSTWSGFTLPLLQAMWNPSANTAKPGWHSTIDGRLILGGIVFVIVLSMIASSSNTAGSVITLILVGLWIIFLVQNGVALKNGKEVPAGVVNDLIAWFTAHSQTGTTTTTSKAGG